MFVSYQDKVFDTVLGPVTVTRARYQYAACGHGLRCQQASRPQDQIWPAPRNQTPAA